MQLLGTCVTGCVSTSNTY